MAELTWLEGSFGEWPPFPDTVRALRTLAAVYRLGVISNVDNDLFALTASRLGVSFQWVVTAEDAGFHKPRGRPGPSAGGPTITEEGGWATSR